MLQDYACELRNADFGMVGFLCLIGKREAQQWRFLLGMSDAFHRSYFNGLVLQRVQTVHVTNEQLQG